jgi:hypothetical protein
MEHQGHPLGRAQAVQDHQHGQPHPLGHHRLVLGVAPVPVAGHRVGHLPVQGASGRARRERSCAQAPVMPFRAAETTTVASSRTRSRWASPLKLSA